MGRDFTRKDSKIVELISQEAQTIEIRDWSSLKIRPRSLPANGTVSSWSKREKKCSVHKLCSTAASFDLKQITMPTGNQEDTSIPWSPRTEKH